MTPMGHVVGVVGARGGAGASVLAASLAATFAASHDAGVPGAGRAAGADLTAGGGLDVVLGIEDVLGLRWPDLHQARGDVDGIELRSVLPHWSGVAVVSGDRLRPSPTPPDVVEGVVRALADVHAAVLLDLDRVAVLDDPPPTVLGLCRTVLLVVPLDLRAVAGAVALRGSLGTRVGDVRLVVRGPSPGGLGVSELEHVLGLPMAGTLPYRRRLDAALDAGAGPPRRGAYARAIGRLAQGLR